jgi:hypothetical protein
LRVIPPMQIEEPVGTCHTIKARRALPGARARTMAAFDIGPHNVGNGRALVDDRHPWIYCDQRLQRRSLAQLGPSTCKGYDSRGDQPMGPVSRKEARSDDRKWGSDSEGVPSGGRQSCCRAHDMAIRRVVAAGAQPITWLGMAGELQRDWARTERLGAVAQILFDHAGASGAVLAWELANEAQRA